MEINYIPCCAYCGKVLKDCICIEEDNWWDDGNFYGFWEDDED
jgi:hypothetical protein